MTANESSGERDSSARHRETSADAVSEASEAAPRISLRIRWARRGYVLFAGTFVIGVAIQVFIAGMAVFVDPMNWSMHAGFVHVLELLSLTMLVLAFLGRLPRGLKLFPVVLFVLIGVQYATALGFSNSVVAAIHPVNALVIFWGAVSITRRAVKSI